MRNPLYALPPTRRNGDGNVDVAPNRIGIGADFMCGLNQLFGLFLVNSHDSYSECGRQHEAAGLVPAETNFSKDFDIFVSKSQAGFTTYAQERVLEASGITAGEAESYL